MTMKRQDRRLTTAYRDIERKAFVSAAIAHLGDNYDTEQGRAYSVQHWEEMRLSQQLEQQLIEQDGRAVPTYDAIAYLPWVSDGCNWLHLARVELNGIEDVRAVRMPTQDRPSAMVSPTGRAWSGGLRWGQGHWITRLRNFRDE
ncbi:MAG: hypothetical protein AAGD25_06385 [Cyanobacteria bacterium P01_F01_bin.150]